MPYIEFAADSDQSSSATDDVGQSPLVSLEVLSISLLEVLFLPNPGEYSD